uniref:Transcription initiation factor TFIID subunit 13 n=2 Tax=Durocryptodira TaxID=1579337 RepID=A0A8C3F625_CHRPI
MHRLVDLSLFEELSTCAKCAAKLEQGSSFSHSMFSVSPVRCMMYGFGDDQNPYTESVDILEDLVIEFITEMVGSIKKSA